MSVCPYNAGNTKQQLKLVGETIEVRTPLRHVLDIAEAKETPGARIGSWMEHDGENQKWKFDSFAWFVETVYFMAQLDYKFIDS